MSWYAVRLELARTPKFPQGSPSRSYILHLPLLPDGKIDEGVLSKHPAKALVRRFWPSEPDLVGMLVSTNGSGWAFSYRDGPDDDERLFRLSDHDIVAGNYLTVSEPDGDVLPYRVTDVRSIAQP